MTEDNKIADEQNKIAENEYNYDPSLDNEFNETGEEFSFGSENQLNDFSDDNAVGSATADNKTPNNIFDNTAANSVGAVTKTVQTVSGNASSFLYKIVLGIVAVVGAVIVGTNFVNSVRTENAKFIKVEANERSISMCVDVVKWSEDLKVRITGKDFTDELSIEKPYYEEEWYQYERQHGYGQDQDAESTYQWLDYYLESGESGDEITLEIIGAKIFMSEVIDTKKIVLDFNEGSEFIDPDKPDDFGLWKDCAKFIDVQSYERSVSIYYQVFKWSENLKIRVSGNDFTDYIDIAEYDENVGRDQYPSSDDNGERNERFIYYYVESGESGDEITLDIVYLSGETEFVIDTVSMVLEIDDYDDPYYPDEQDYPSNEDNGDMPNEIDYTDGFGRA